MERACRMATHMHFDPQAEALKHGRVIVIVQGAHWPAWAVGYRELRLSDSVVAQNAAGAQGGLASRIRHTADELRCMGLAVEQMLISVPPHCSREGIISAVNSAAAGAAMQSGTVT